MNRSDFDGQGCLAHLLQHPTIRDYYSRTASPDAYAALTFQLVLEAIANRLKYMQPVQQSNLFQQVQQQPEKKHYNVALIKHPRFLSPSQNKHRIADKVTEVVPVRDTQIIIYGKPKVRIGQGGCVVHTGKCQQDTTSKVSRNMRQSQQNIEYAQAQPQSYLPPKGKLKKVRSNKVLPSSEVTAPYFPATSQSIPIKSPASTHRQCKDNYEKVESRIKFLIDKDKRSKKLQKKVDQQNEALKRIEERQLQLLKRQQQQYKEVESNIGKISNRNIDRNIASTMPIASVRSIKPLKISSKQTFNLSSSSQSSVRSSLSSLSSSSLEPQRASIVKPVIKSLLPAKSSKPKISIQLPKMDLEEDDEKSEEHVHDENCSCEDDSDLDNGNFGTLLKT